MLFQTSNLSLWTRVMPGCRATRSAKPLGLVAGDDRDLLDPALAEEPDLPLDDRDALDLDQGFGPVGGEGHEPGARPGGHDDRVHGL